MSLPLEQLNDILPGPFPTFDSIWFWGGLLFLIILYVLIKRFIRWYPRYRLYRKALKELNIIFKENENFVPSVNLLLKKYASLFWSRDTIATLHHEAWLTFLDQQAKTSFRLLHNQWMDWSYGAAQPDLQERKKIYRLCKQWIKTIKQRTPL